jgi:PDZ domain
MINNSFHPHVWFRNSNDVFTRNVVSSPYMPIGIPVWGKETDYNIFPDSVSLKAAWSRGTDKHSVCGYLDFVDPKNGDFRLKDGSIAFKTGFKNFTMDSFGVVSSWLKALAKKPALPAVVILDNLDNNEVIDFIGARVKNLATLGERSATGMDDTRGVLVVEVMPGSGAAGFLQANDVILSLNGVKVNKLRDLLEARRSVIGSGTEIVIFRNQKEIKMHVELNGK